MKPFVKNVATIFFAISICAGCSKDDEPGPTKKYTGDPYMGSVKVSIKSSNPDHGIQTEYGDGSAVFTITEDGNSNLTVSGSIGGEEGNAGFSLDGFYDGERWVADSSHLVISEDGMITGEASTGEDSAFPQKLTFSGTVSEFDLELKVDTEILKASEGGFPAGTVFSFTYDLSRSVDSNGNKKEDGNDDSGCKNIRWELRNVWTGGGNLALISVPVCYD